MLKSGVAGLFAPPKQKHHDAQECCGQNGVNQTPKNLDRPVHRLEGRDEAKGTEGGEGSERESHHCLGEASGRPHLLAQGLGQAFFHQTLDVATEF